METRVGRYIVDRLLARGGMAEVFLARAEGPAGFSKQVVIKRILPQFIEEERFVKMFLDEARLAALLNHPNIVQVFDFGEDQGTYYLAMEYIDGDSVRNVVRHFTLTQRRLNPRLAAHMVAGACEGLHYAHSLTDANGASYNVIHRDISPDNLLVSTSGITKVVDFGIAKAAVNANRTEAGTIKGKYAYMAPELIRGEGVDRGVDVYALGVVLYELLTGERPYVAENELQLLRLILAGRPRPIAELNPSVPPALVEIAEQAMAERGRRFADARQLQGALEDYLALEKPRINAVDVAELILEVQKNRRERQQGPSSGPKAVPGFPISGVQKRDPQEGQKTEIGLPPLAPVPAAALPPTRPSPPRRATRPAAAQPLLDRETRIQDLDATGRLDLDTQALPSMVEDDLAPARGRPRWLLPALVVGALAIVGVGVVALTGGPADEGPARHKPVARPTMKLEPTVVGAPEPAKPADPPVAKQPEPEPGGATEPVVAKPVEPEPEKPAEPVVAKPAQPEPAPPAKADPTVAPKPTPRAEPRKVAVVAAGTGMLTVRSEPWCEVYVAGKKVGVTPLARHPLPAGSHKVSLRNEGAGIRRELVVRIKADEEAKEAVVFKVGKIAVRVSPWAEVRLDGKKIGTTPMDPFEVVTGSHELLLSNPEIGKSEKLKVVVKEGVQEVVKAIWD